MIIESETKDLDTSTGKMRTYVYRPKADGIYPGLILYSEIFQQTAPIARAAAMYAGHGMIVAVPEIFHELETPGQVLAYDQAGADKGNLNKITKTLKSYDDDTAVLVKHLCGREDCSKKLGAVGICIGGHLSFRAAMHNQIRAAACFYATDIHKSGLGEGVNDDSLERISEIRGELMMIWGRQDPHIPIEGRRKIYDKLSEAGVSFTWHEFNGAHAFMRDEGPRYDPELALTCYALAIGLFKRSLS